MITKIQTIVLFYMDSCSMQILYYALHIPYNILVCGQLTVVPCLFSSSVTSSGPMTAWAMVFAKISSAPTPAIMATTHSRCHVFTIWTETNINKLKVTLSYALTVLLGLGLWNMWYTLHILASVVPYTRRYPIPYTHTCTCEIIMVYIYFITEWYSQCLLTHYTLHRNSLLVCCWQQTKEDRDVHQ